MVTSGPEEPTIQATDSEAVTPPEVTERPPFVAAAYNLAAMSKAMPERSVCHSQVPTAGVTASDPPKSGE